ncbi:hypothetical protein GCM10022206_02030 [Streptomyces chiangmaiensis]
MQMLYACGKGRYNAADPPNFDCLAHAKVPAEVDRTPAENDTDLAEIASLLHVYGTDYQRSIGSGWSGCLVMRRIASRSRKRWNP